MHHRRSTHHDLLFLLSLGGLGTGCIIITDDTDTDAAGSDTTPKDLTTSSTGGNEGDTEVATSAATDGGTSTTGTVDDTGTTAGPPDGTTTEGPGTVCEAYANLYAECIGDPKAYDPSLEYCDMYLAGAQAYSPECGAAAEAYYACLLTLDCKAFLSPDSCPDELAVVEQECPVVEG